MAVGQPGFQVYQVTWGGVDITKYIQNVDFKDSVSKEDDHTINNESESYQGGTDAATCDITFPSHVIIGNILLPDFYNLVTRQLIVKYGYSDAPNSYTFNAWPMSYDDSLKVKSVQMGKMTFCSDGPIT